ncbi:vWA domain-containing protein [Scatolibacter rhodanostii]|uniref:vWA domain-containing protein n=1 Tax=Scatolibacter rhodanostii TaxID=2014781 RepID=UPI000C076EDE|nr:vWA domain-containing protein [Scatolibacter rhodanostii]
MQKKQGWILLLVLAIVGWTIPFTVYAEDIQADFQIEIRQQSIQDRTFTIHTQVWSNEQAIKEISAAGTVIFLEVSESMMNLADSPQQSLAYAPAVSHESMDRKALLYTLEDEEYKPVILKDNQYYIAICSDDGKMTAGEKKIGDFDLGKAVFTQTVYQKGSSQTKLEKAKQELSEFLKDMAAVSEKNQITFVYYSGSATVGERQSLTVDGLKKLLSELNGCEQYLSVGYENAEVIEEAYAELIEMQEAEIENLNMLHYSDSVWEESDESKEEMESSIRSIKTLGAKIYGIGDFKKDEEAEQDFLQLISSEPKEKYGWNADTTNLSDILETVLEGIAEKMPIEVRFVLNTRFELTEAAKKKVLEQGGSVTQGSDGKQAISLKAVLPKAKEKPWQTELTIQAKNSFFGGNDVTVLDKESGLYWYGEQKKQIAVSAVNVPVLQPIEILKTEICLGQPVPALIEKQSLLSVAFGGNEPEWYGQDKTGNLSYLWTYESGGSIGTIKQLQNIRPAKDEKYVLNVSFKPSTSGENSVGEPCAESVSKSKYEVKVATGSVQISMSLFEKEAEMDKESTFLFALQGENFTQYRTLSNENRNQDGESIVWEVTFENLPFGRYTLKNVSDNNEKQWERICAVGFEENSDIVSKKNADCVVSINRNDIEKNDNMTVSERKFRVISDKK